MNIYLVTQDENEHYDTYSGMVVFAENEEEARNIHPDESTGVQKDKIRWDGLYPTWASSPSNVNVFYLGKASTGFNRGIVLTSFHAG